MRANRDLRIIVRLASDLGRWVGHRAILGLGAIPAALLGSTEVNRELVMVPAELTLFTSMFMHGGFMHWVGNRRYLCIFGDNIEDRMGHARFLAFYLSCGLIAAWAHVASDVTAQIPMIVASGPFQEWSVRT